MYAVKCNNDPMLMRWMKEIHPDLGFDCASLREIGEALPIVKPEKIIYAQPCKKEEDSKIAQARGVGLTVVDSVEEVETLGKANWFGQILVRLLVEDGGSKQPFGKKFGAPFAWLPRIYEAARHYKLEFAGFSFHVGSECASPKQYPMALAAAKRSAQVAKQYNYDTTIIDIGGGFLHTQPEFTQTAHAINSGLNTYWNDPAIQLLAEPGRFLAAPTHTLYTTVIGKKPVYPPPANTHDPAYRVTVDESVYAAFSNIPFDHQTPLMERLRPPVAGETKRPTIVFGRTCDSGDCISTNAPLYDLQIGDVLRVPNMGAYTTVTATEFNGFPVAQKIYEAHLA